MLLLNAYAGGLINIETLYLLFIHGETVGDLDC